MPFVDHRLCAWDFCTSRREKTSPLCHEHMLLVYAIIAKQHANSQVPKPDLPKPAPRPERPGTVYYVQIGTHIKIGHAKNLWNRMRAYPPTAVLLAEEPGTVELEKARHLQFRAFLDVGREWFTQAPELLAHIEQVRREHQQRDFDVWAHRAGKPTPVRPRGWSGKQ